MVRENEGEVFKIRHESRGLYIALTVVMIFWAIGLFCLPFSESDIFQSWTLWVNIASTAVLIVCALLFFIYKAAGVKVRLSEEKVTIRSLFGKRTIAYKDITSVHVERYKSIRRRRHADKYRMRLRIYGVSGRPVVLTDNATSARGLMGLLGIFEELPDQDVPLYGVYLNLKEIIDARRQADPS